MVLDRLSYIRNKGLAAMMRSSCILLATLAVALPCQSEHKGAPWYEDRSNLLFYKDDQGRMQQVHSQEDWVRRVAHIRANMELVMGPLPKPSSLPLDLTIDDETRLRYYARRHVTFTVEEGDRLPGWLLVPHDADVSNRRPGAVCLPGSADPGKDRPAGLTDDVSMAYAHELVERGYVCLVIDYPLLHTTEYETNPYALNYASATMKGIVNHRRGVDVLQSLPYVDPQAIGVIGHSLGGHNALFLAVFDERVKAIVSSCGFNVFAKHNGGDVRAWSSRYYMPRIKTVYGDVPARIPFDFTEVLAALAPRAVFANAPLHDAPDFEVSGVRDCFSAAEPVYRRVFQAEDRLAVCHPDTGHAFPAAERLAAYAFLDRYLLPREDSVSLEEGLAAHWPAFSEPREIPASEAVRLGNGDFTVATWVQSDDVSDRLSGDLICQYDRKQRRGFHFTLKNNTGVTSNQSNWRHLQFGIDDQRDSPWRDCGRPGRALFAFALAVHEGALYAGTCEPEKNDSGHVYRYAGGQQWIDCGAPDRSNSVTALAIHQGELYAATGKYRVAGSALAESENTTLGGRVFRYVRGSRWIDCGQLPETEAVGGLVVFRGHLYASSMYNPPGLFRYEGGTDWTAMPVVQGPHRRTGEIGPRRVNSLTVYDGFIYATTYDGGRIYRFDGETWTDCGQLGDNTQTYAFTSYEGQLHVATWPSGRVFRFEGLDQWADVGRLGEELEVMGMVVQNGRLVAGTLPLGQVYSYEGGNNWKLLQQIDHTLGVKYRRVWTMAEHGGEVFCSTLPSGKIFVSGFGHQAQWGHSLSSEWHHVAGVKSAERLELYVDGERVAQTPKFDGADFQLETDAPLQIGFGTNGPLNGRLADVRMYTRALNSAEIELLAQQAPR